MAGQAVHQSPEPDLGAARRSGPSQAVPRASAEAMAWLSEHRREIIEDWVERLAVLSSSYRTRPVEELFFTVTRALDANLEVMGSDRVELIDSFIDYITAKRLDAGFPLSDVQKAFELFRTVVVARLGRPGTLELLAQITPPLNSCLSYTIHRFSDHFQKMHELAILRHAQNLEKEIEARTAELAESERRYKTLVEEITDGYFVIQEERIAFANQAFCQMHRARLEGVVGRNFLEFVAPADRNRVRRAYRSTLSGRPGGKTLEYHRQGPAPDKSATEIKSRVVDLGQGPVTIGICRDISERKAMEAKVRESERLAYVGHLTASLSHEIRNPLSAVKMNMQLLQRRLDLAGYDKRRLEICVHEVGRLEEILQKLLDHAKPLDLRTTAVDPSQLTQSCLDLLEPKIAQKGIRIKQRHSTYLSTALVDPGELERALINLLLNAIEASPEGGVIEVWSGEESRGPGAFLELGVRDQGPGIEPGQIPHLFTPFHTGKAQGTGLGLSNVKRIVEAHSGQVKVKSGPGRGAEFVMRLPCPA